MADKDSRINAPNKECQNKIGIFDADEYVEFENSVINDLDKFKPFKKFGRYTDKKIFDAINSNEPLTDMQKMAISNLLYEYRYFRAYFETVQEAVRLFGDKKGELKDVLGKALMSLRGYLGLWRFFGERSKRYLSGIHQTEESRSKLNEVIKSMDENSRKSFKYKNRKNGKDIFKVVGDYHAMINYEVKYGAGNPVSTKIKKDILERIKNRYKYPSVSAVQKSLYRAGVKGLPGER